LFLNVKVDRAVDKVINDEIKSSEGLSFLFKKGFDENVLSKILSVGVLGLKKNKEWFLRGGVLLRQMILWGRIF